MAKTTKSQARTKRERSEFLWGWLFILPTTIGLIVLNIIPIFQTIYQSFFKTGDFGKGNIFIGLQNYQKVFADKEIWQALINTFKYAIVEVPFSIVIALVLAVLLNRKMKGRSIYRTIIFLPMVAAPAAVAMVWRWLFNSDYGLINNVFHVHVNWVSDPKIAVFSVAIIGVWSIIGYNMVLFLAGLQEIPRDYYEAAEIDGCTNFKFLYTIGVPLIKPSLGALIIYVFLQSWNYYLWPLLVTDSVNMRTVQIGLGMLQGAEATDFRPVMAGAMVILIPSILVFIIGQKQMISGLTAGAVKG